MGVVTVVGAGGGQIQVTVDGGRAQALAESYANQVLGAWTDGSLTTDYLQEGENEVVEPNRMVQGIVTIGGAYDLTGNFSNVLIGVAVPDGADPMTPLNPLSSRVTVNAAAVTSSYLNVLSGDMAGVDFTVGNYDGTFDATFGDNVFRGAGTTGNWTIVAGAGNDTIYGTDGYDDIDVGVGSNAIFLGSGTNVVASRGQDTIDGLSSSKTNVTVYGGSSNLKLGVNSFVDDSATVGSFISVGDYSTVTGGIGSTLVFTGANGSVYGATSDTISAVGNLMVSKGLNQTISVDGALGFINGSGNTSIVTRSGTVWGATNLSLALDASDRLIYTANQPGATGNQYVDASKSAGWVEFWSGPGSETLIGGYGYNHFVFGTAFEGTSGDSFATVKAAHGLSDFGVLRGHTGGHITIEDFLSNSDNKFFMYNYKPQNAAAEVQKLLKTAVVEGNNTTITLDNNMTVTFVGLTQLNASNFVIS